MPTFAGCSSFPSSSASQVFSVGGGRNGMPRRSLSPDRRTFHVGSGPKCSAAALAEPAHVLYKRFTFSSPIPIPTASNLNDENLPISHSPRGATLFRPLHYLSSSRLRHRRGCPGQRFFHVHRPRCRQNRSARQTKLRGPYARRTLALPRHRRTFLPHPTEALRAHHTRRYHARAHLRRR